MCIELRNVFVNVNSASEPYAFSQGVVLRSLLPASLSEHMLMSQANHPPTHWTTLCMRSELSSPPCGHRMCVVARRLGCLQTLTHGHVIVSRLHVSALHFSCADSSPQETRIRKAWNRRKEMGQAHKGVVDVTCCEWMTFKMRKSVTYPKLEPHAGACDDL